jgi:hypothetical protein
MKKQFAFIVMALSVAVSAWSQKSSVKLQVGYGIPLAGSSISSNSSQNGSNSSASLVSGSFGSGLTIEAGYTYSFAALISTQVDFAYLIGNEYNSTTTYSNYYLLNESYSSNFFQVAPLVRFDVGEGSIHPYVAIGPAFGFGNIKYKEYQNNDGGISDRETKYDGGVAVGTKGILGLELTKGNLGFFVQATLINLSYAPTKAELTKYISNGTDVLPSTQTYYKETEFKSSISSNGQIDHNQPNQQLLTYYPFSSLSLNLGVRLKF